MRRAAWIFALSIVPTMMACNDATPAQNGTPDLGGASDLAGPPEADAAPDLGSPTTSGWQGGFQLPGLAGSTGGQIYVLTDGKNGHVFAGGSFIDAAGTPAHNVAEWTGAGWRALGDGVADTVRSLAVGPDGALYAGTFTATTAPHHLHRWDGAKWDEIPGDLDGDVLTLATQGQRLLVGGRFSSAGGVSAARIAAYVPGTGFSAIGPSGADDQVDTLVVDDATHFCMGGQFGKVGGVGALNVACFDGSAWAQLGDGLNGGVSRLIKSADGTYYAGGTFLLQSADPNQPGSTYGLAALKGGTWQWKGGGVDLGTTTEVRALAFDGDGKLLIGGDFVLAGGEFVQNLARYDVTTGTFSDVAGGVHADIGLFVTSGVNDILPHSDGAFTIAGFFTTVNKGQLAASNIAHLQGSTWSALTDASRKYLGISGLVNALTVDKNGGIIAGGLFKQVGQIAAANIARFQGGAWTALGDGLNGSVSVVYTRANGDLLAGGPFSSSGSVAVPGLARWNGTAWSALGDPLDGAVSAIAEDAQGNLYIGGAFTSAGSVTLNRVARWNGSAWTALGEGFDADVLALAIDAGGRVIATGQFTHAGTTEMGYLAAWDGSKWSGFGKGLEGAGLLYGTRLIADGQGFILGGTFSSVDGHPAGSLARWDGTQWSDLSAGLSAANGLFLVASLAVQGNELFAGGVFQLPGTTRGASIAHWDGKAWGPLGSGLDDLCGALALSGKTLWAGGGFVVAGGQVSAGIAAWQP